jgi:hypothetical protein
VGKERQILADIAHAARGKCTLPQFDTINPHRALVQGEQASSQVQHCPGATRAVTEQHKEFAGLEIEREIMDQETALLAVAQLLQHNRHCTFPLNTSTADQSCRGNCLQQDTRPGPSMTKGSNRERSSLVTRG